MSEFTSKYCAKKPNAAGYIEYSEVENQTWQSLYHRQILAVEGRACDEFIRGLKILGLNADAIPQLPDISAALTQATGWAVEPVAALIPHDQFFTLLANRKFPAATFIRTPEELDYVQEPDIFHEVFGHCPLLTEPLFAEYVEAYGKLVLAFDEQDLPLLQRLFWFTVEFGLIQTDKGPRIYGGGILSSYQETLYCIESTVPQRHEFDPVAALRTPYRIDILQPVYFTIHSFEQLYDCIKSDIHQLLKTARALKEFAPTFPVIDGAVMHIHCC